MYVGNPTYLRSIDNCTVYKRYVVVVVIKSRMTCNVNIIQILTDMMVNSLMSGTICLDNIPSWTAGRVNYEPRDPAEWTTICESAFMLLKDGNWVCN